MRPSRSQPRAQRAPPSPLPHVDTELTIPRPCGATVPVATASAASGPFPSPPRRYKTHHTSHAWCDRPGRRAVQPSPRTRGATVPVARLLGRNRERSERLLPLSLNITAELTTPPPFRDRDGRTTRLTVPPACDRDGRTTPPRRSRHPCSGNVPSLRAFTSTPAAPGLERPNRKARPRERIRCSRSSANWRCGFRRIVEDVARCALELPRVPHHAVVAPLLPSKLGATGESTDLV